MQSVTRMPGGDTPLKAWARALALTAPIARNPAVTLPIQIGELADVFGDKIALIGEDETVSYRDRLEDDLIYADGQFLQIPVQARPKE